MKFTIEQAVNKIEVIIPLYGEYFTDFTYSWFKRALIEGSEIVQTQAIPFDLSLNFNQCNIT